VCFVPAVSLGKAVMNSASIKMLSDTCSFLRLENRFGFQISTHKKQINKTTRTKNLELIK
jgi:hypothetical protein